MLCVQRAFSGPSQIFSFLSHFCVVKCAVSANNVCTVAARICILSTSCTYLGAHVYLSTPLVTDEMKTTL